MVIAWLSDVMVTFVGGNGYAGAAGGPWDLVHVAKCVHLGIELIHGLLNP